MKSMLTGRCTCITRCAGIIGLQYTVKGVLNDTVCTVCLLVYHTRLKYLNVANLLEEELIEGE